MQTLYSNMYMKLIGSRSHVSLDALINLYPKQEIKLDKGKDDIALQGRGFSIKLEF